MKNKILALLQTFRIIFNFQDDESKGRIIALSSTLLTTFYNVFISGIFYTGFLTMYDMSITDAGIISFIPFITGIFNIFAPKFLGHFKRRKPILLIFRVVYFFLYIVLITIMPQFVHAPSARLLWFIIILIVSTIVGSLYSNGLSIWMYNFYPKDNNLRARYLTISQVCSSILSSIILLGSSALTDALKGSPYQNQLILGFRYFAFFLVLIEVFLLSKAKEYPCEESAKIRVSEVLTLPFKYRKFILCNILCFAWLFISYLTGSGTWGYHLLNHLDLSYSLINGMSVLYTVCLLFLSPLWNRVLRRYSWIKTAGIAMLIFAPSELVMFCLSKNSLSLFVPTSIYQNIASVGLNLAFANIIFMNLPKENSTTHFTFYAIGYNLSAFLGSAAGTWISSITGDSSITLLGIEVYSVQYLTIIRFFALCLVGIVLLFKWRSFTSNDEIARVEQLPQSK